MSILTLKTIIPFLSGSLGLFCAGVIFGLGNTSVLAADFRTTITLDNPGYTRYINTVVMNWSTSLASGIVTESNLDQWSYQ